MHSGGVWRCWCQGAEMPTLDHTTTEYMHLNKQQNTILSANAPTLGP